MTPIITGPGSYRTREGKRVEVTRWHNCDDAPPWRADGGMNWRPNGKRYGQDDADHYTDILGPWLDEVRIEPIPRDFRPIPGRHKAVYREGRQASVYGVTESVFETDGRYARFGEYRDGMYPNGGCAGDRLDIIAFIDTKPDHTPTTKETPMPTTAPTPFTSIDQIKVGMRVRVIDGNYSDDLMEKMRRGATVTEITANGAVQLRADGGMDSFCFLLPWMAPSSPLEEARAEVARLEAEEAAAKALASMPEPLRKCHEYLKANPNAFGCQRKHVVAIVEALTGGKLP